MKLSDRRRVRLLGPASVDLISVQDELPDGVGGLVPRFRSWRTIGLLGYLTAERRPVARDLLAVLFWPDEEISRGRANLSRELHNLTRILPGCWDSNRRTIAFIPSAHTDVDLYQLQRLKAHDRWDEAAEILGGEFLEGLNFDQNAELENWLLGERERWQSLSLTVLNHAVKEKTNSGRYEDALELVRRQLQLAPWDEDTHTQTMRLLVWTDQRGAALKQFETCKQVLRDELDVDPCPETIALYHQIQDGKLAAPPQLPAYLTGEQAKHEYSPMPFVGREDELAKLESYLHEALTGKSRIVFISGGPGRGKTALLEAFSQRAMEINPKILVAGGKGNAYSGVGDPYLPFRDMMTMLAGDVEHRWDAGAITQDHAQRLWASFPSIVEEILTSGSHLVDVLVPEDLLLGQINAIGDANEVLLTRMRELIKLQQNRSMEVEQSLVFQQITRVIFTISKHHPLFLILDDLQWADKASISLLFHLGRHLIETDGRLMIACAYRPEEVSITIQGQRHPLAKVLSEFKRTFGDIWVDLGRFDENKDRGFVGDLVDIEPNRLSKDFRDAIYDRTRGHPLFTIELLRAMRDRGDLHKDTDGAWIEGLTLDWDLLPAKVEAVIEERINCLDSELQEILSVASVEGEVFTAQVVAKVQAQPDNKIMSVLSQELEGQYRLINRQEEVRVGLEKISRYSFGHSLFREYLLKRLSRWEKLYLNGAVAEALEDLFQGHEDRIYVQLANHFDEADESVKAFHYYSMAGDRAAHIFAYGEAINHYSKAILLTEKFATDIDSLASLYRGRGLSYVIVGEYDRARDDLETALKISHETGENQVELRILIDLGRLWSAQDHSQAFEYFETALELARRLDEPEILAGSLNWMGNWHMNSDNHKQAVMYHQEALKIFEELENQQELVNTLDLLGMANLMGGDHGKSIRHFNQAIKISRNLGNRRRLASTLLGRATNISLSLLLVSVPFASPRDPSIDLEEALQIADELDMASEKMWAYWTTGLLFTMRGEFGKALESLETALEMAEKVEHLEFVVSIQFALGVLYMELIAKEESQRHLKASLKLAGELNSRMWIHIASGSLSAYYLSVGDYDNAEKCIELAISHNSAMDTLGLRNCWMRRAELFLAQDDPALALEIIDRLIQTAPGLSEDAVITYLWLLKGKALATLGKKDEAILCLLDAHRNSEKTGERFLQWRVCAFLGHLYKGLDKEAEAKREFESARSVIDEIAVTIKDEKVKTNFLQETNKIIMGPY